MSSSPPSSKFCWICGKSVSLECCKTDEHGNAVHEKCQVVRLALAKGPEKVKTPPRGGWRERA